MAADAALMDELGSTDTDLSDGDVLRTCARVGMPGVLLLKRSLLERYACLPGAAPLLKDLFRRFLQRPVLPGGPGVCNVLLVWENLCADCVLRDAFFLPLQWVPAVDAAGVPAALVDLGRDVVRELDEDASWRLQFAPGRGFDGWDLRGLELDVPSAWVGLAAALLCAVRGGSTRPDVAVSARWDPSGKRFSSVSGLREKLAAARSLGCTRFFLSAADAEICPAEEWAPMELTPLVSRGAKLGRALSELLHVMQVPPGPEADFSVRCAYADSFPRQARSKREDYIMDCITRERADVLRRARGSTACSDLVVVASSPSVALLSVLALRPGRCAIVTTKEMEAKQRIAQTIVGRLEKWGVQVDIDRRLLDDTRDESALREAIGRWDPKGLWVDVTGGTKGMSVRAALAAGDAGATVFHIESSGIAGHASGTEEIVVLSGPGAQKAYERVRDETER